MAERPFGRLSEIPKIPRTAFCPFSPENETASTISAKIPRFCQMASEPKNALKMPEIIKFLPGVGTVLSEVRNHVCEVKNSLSVARMTMSKRADVVGHAANSQGTTSFTRKTKRPPVSRPNLPQFFLTACWPNMAYFPRKTKWPEGSKTQNFPVFPNGFSASFRGSCYSRNTHIHSKAHYRSGIVACKLVSFE